MTLLQSTTSEFSYYKLIEAPRPGKCTAWQSRAGELRSAKNLAILLKSTCRLEEAQVMWHLAEDESVSEAAHDTETVHPNPESTESNSKLAKLPQPTILLRNPQHGPNICHRRSSHDNQCQDQNHRHGMSVRACAAVPAGEPLKVSKLGFKARCTMRRRKFGGGLTPVPKRC
jgi:hypothetical protein